MVRQIGRPGRDVRAAQLTPSGRWARSPQHALAGRIRVRRDSLRRAVHAHVWTGGADSWVWAVPMDGQRPARPEFHRGRAVGLLRRVPGPVHQQQPARSPLPAPDRHAPRSRWADNRAVLPPGERYRLAWHLDWYVPGRLPRRPVRRRGFGWSLGPASRSPSAGPPWSPSRFPSGASRECATSTCDTTGAGPGSRACSTRRCGSLPSAAPSSCWTATRASSPTAAATPSCPSTPTQLTVLAGGWEDWSDRRERVGSALLLQQLRRLGWGDRRLAEPWTATASSSSSTWSGRMARCSTTPSVRPPSAPCRRPASAVQLSLVCPLPARRR